MVTSSTSAGTAGGVRARLPLSQPAAAVTACCRDCGAAGRAGPRWPTSRRPAGRRRAPRAAAARFGRGCREGLVGELARRCAGTDTSTPVGEAMANVVASCGQLVRRQRTFTGFATRRGRSTAAVDVQDLIAGLGRHAGSE